MSNPAAETKYIRFVEKTPIWIAISVLTIVIGIGAMFYNYSQMGSVLRMGLAFTGGQSLLLQFKEELQPDGQDAKAIVDKYSDGDAVVQVYANDRHRVSIKLKVKAEGETEQAVAEASNLHIIELKKELGDAFGGYSEDPTSLNPVTLEQSFVGPTVGRELIWNAIWALVVGCVLIMIFILYRFGGWHYSLAGIVALIHDVQITLTVTAILRLEVSESFIAVILTIIGYSINDTIIIFDRIRENLRLHGDRIPFPTLCNISLTQTLTRSLNTVLTVVIMIVAMLAVGGVNIRDFLIAMLTGMLSGAYSSIFIATPVMLWLSKGQAPKAASDDSAPALAVAGPAGVPQRESASALPPEVEADGVSRFSAGDMRQRNARKQRRR
jgi:preprotein translocase SecF subunit